MIMTLRMRGKVHLPTGHALRNCFEVQYCADRHALLKSMAELQANPTMHILETDRPHRHAASALQFQSYRSLQLSG